MVELKSESELLNLFRPRDRKHIELPKNMQFPIQSEHYIAWSEPSGMHVYLVFNKPKWKSPAGIVFERTNSGNYAGPTNMCDWCHSYGPSDQIGLLSVSVTSRITVGKYLCLDLGCIERLDQAANLSGRSLDKMALRLRERMTTFYDEVFEIKSQL